MEQVKQVLKQVQLYKQNPKEVKLSLPRKREYVETVYVCLLNNQLDKKQVLAMQSQIVDFAITIAFNGCGNSLNKALTSLFQCLYNNGGDPSKLQTEFFDPLLSKMLDNKTSYFLKVSLLRLSSMVFRETWQRCGNPPTKELFEVYCKLWQSQKSADDKHTKHSIFQSLKMIIRANPYNLFQIQGDIFKFVFKVIKEEKVVTKKNIMACLATLIKNTLNFSGMHQYYEVIFAAAVKGFEEKDEGTRTQCAFTLFNLLNLRLQESLQQGDIKTFFKTYNKKEAGTVTNKKSKTIEKLDAPRCLADIVALFGSMFFRMIQANNGQLNENQRNVRHGLIYVLGLIIEHNMVHLEATDPDQIIMPLLLSLPNPKECGQEGIHQRDGCQWILTHATKFMTNAQKIEALKLCLNCLEKKQLLLKLDSLNNMTSFLPKNSKMPSTMFNQHQLIVLIRMINDLIFELEGSHIYNNFGSEREILDPLMQYLKDSSEDVKFYSAEVCKTLGLRAPSWIHQLISIFLSHTSIANADIVSIEQVPIYGPDAYDQKTQQLKPKARALKQQVEYLNSQALIVAALISNVQETVKGVPLAIAQSALNVAKGMILGSWQMTDTDSHSQIKLEKIDLNQDQRREAGWTLLEGLLKLGPTWIQTNVEFIEKLFSSSFNQQMCLVDPKMLKSRKGIEILLQEFKLKTRAISCLKAFAKACATKTMQQKQIGQEFLQHAQTFFLAQSEFKELIQKFFPKLLIEAKSNMFACFSLIPARYYVKQFVNLLHPTCSAIVNERLPDIDLLKKVIDFEDIRVNTKLVYKVEEENCLNTPYSHRQKTYQSLAQKRLPILFDALDAKLDGAGLDQKIVLESVKPLTELKSRHLNYNQRHSDQLINAIEVFAAIFVDDKLSEKNKMQLLKHFVAHSTPAVQEEQPAKKKKKDAKPAEESFPQSKVLKLIQIALCLVKISQENQECLANKNIEFREQVTIFMQNCLKANNDLLTTIIGQLFVYQNITSILSSPGAGIQQVLKQVVECIKKSKEGPSKITHKKYGCVVFGSLCRLLDFETIFQPQKQCIKLLSQEMNILLKDGESEVRRFSLHYTGVICAQQGFDTNQYFFNAIFINAFYQLQMDIFQDTTRMVAMSRIFKANLLRQIQDGGDFEDSLLSGELLSNPNHESIQRRLKIVQREILDAVTGPKVTKNRHILSEGLDILKLELLRSENLSWLEQPEKLSQITSNLFKILQDHETKMCSDLDSTQKIKVTETIAAILYKGHLRVLQKETNNCLLFTLVDAINNCSSRGVLPVKCSQVLLDNEQFSELINFNNWRENDSLSLNKALHTLMLMILKYTFASAKSCCIEDLLQFAKTISSYSHTTKLQAFEKVPEIGEEPKSATEKQSPDSFVFAADLREKSLAFVMKSFQTFVKLFCTVETGFASDIRAKAGDLIGLAFSIQSNDSIMLKKVGFDLILTLVSHFSQTVEQIGDEDEEDEEFIAASKRKGISMQQIQQKLQSKNFMKLPLLLEVYEAQIFSIIRQNLTFFTSSKEKGNTLTIPVPPEIQAKNYELINLFLMTPICQDEVIIGKILDMLFDGVEKTYLAGADLHSHESAIANAHFKKLLLLGQLITNSLPSPLTEGLDFVSEYKKENRQVQHKLKTYLPSKFAKKDQEKLAQFWQSHKDLLKKLEKHFMMGLTDILITSSGFDSDSQGNIRKLTFLTGVQDQEDVAKSQKSLLQMVPGNFILTIGHLNSILDGVQYKSNQNDNATIVRSCIVNELIFKQKDQHADQVTFAKKMATEKLRMLRLVEYLLKSGYPLCSTSQEVNELCSVLYTLEDLNIEELSLKIIEILNLLSTQD